MPGLSCARERGMPHGSSGHAILIFYHQIAVRVFRMGRDRARDPAYVEDPAAIGRSSTAAGQSPETAAAYGQKVLKLIAKIRGVHQFVDLASRRRHQTKYSIEEAVAKMISPFPWHGASGSPFIRRYQAPRPRGRTEQPTAGIPMLAGL